MKQFAIDINCDVGEGVGNEAAIFPHISSCNIACGGHAGDKDSMRQIIQLGKSHRVKIGAHPSYPDRANFGREVMDISPESLQQSIREQLSSFMEVLENVGGNLHHIKAHGALYNQIAKDEQLAQIYLETMEEFHGKVKLYVPFNSVIAKMALDRGFDLWYEGFADRNYNPDLSLVSRKLQNAIIHKPGDVLKHILPMIKENRVVSVTGEYCHIAVNTLCVHGDTDSALEILMYLSKELPKQNVQIQ